ncbi:AraC-like DNA-binding protein [Pelomonas saccharophila]|uniref:AraC-like DNA-binding protein n=1 Tax=Roseateles saccharophilus TaxID=304 RepID=A0ABU1YTH8_ROSSA|nr:AraC family transcriptional regulator [Roseateles saccharophilus]MDR7272176.1 AraC-like DNA-binding protein [Roseateles saccharophilus]
MPLPSDAQAERRYQPLQRGSGLRLMHCQCRAARGERAVDEEHQAFSITLVDRGQFTYRTRAGGALLSAGWLMLGNVGEGYACSHEDSDGSGDDCTVLSLSPALLEETLSALGAAGSPNRFGRACLPPLPRVAGLFHALDTGGDEGFALEEAALAIVAQVSRALTDGEAPAALPRQDERARAAAHCIETRSAEALTLEEVARVAGLSPFHLLRVFRQSIGVTPHQYLMRLRLMQGLRLLRDTRLAVTDVAYETGWADLSNFNKAFRREFGCSPRSLRRADRRQLALPA